MSISLGSPVRRWAVALVLAAAACSAGDQFLQPGLEPPASVSATPLSLSSIRVDWVPGASVPLSSYRIERRVSLEGKFQKLADVDPGLTTYFDTGLDPSTFYGYRIIALSRAGERSEASVVAGTHTAPVPGIRYSTGLSATEVDIADPNGYQLSLGGPAHKSLSIGTLDQGVIAPLPPGVYTVTLSDVIPTCNITGGTTRQVTVVDTGLTTQADVSFTAICTDATKGDVVVEVTVQGDSVDKDGYRVDYAGILAGDTVPALGGTVVGGPGGSHLFNGLVPGDYEFSIGDIDLPCLVSGAGTADVQVAPLARDTVRFAVTCPDKSGGNPAAPLVFRNVWTPQTAPNGQTVTLDVVLDLSARPSQDLGVVQATLKYDAAVLTYQSAVAPSPGQLGGLTVNSTTPGTLTWLNFSAASTPPTGVIPAARFTFLVNGTSGNRAITRSTIDLTADFSGAVSLDTLFRVVEDTFTVGAGSGNQAPSAQAGGPYNGTVGNGIAFSSSGSTDADGSISSYQWAFGDGTSSTQANPTKVYATSGSFTATLTVTDNQGATGTDQATVTVTGGGGNAAPTASVGGPYSGAVGSPIGFSSSGSTDSDGSIASYLWDFGDGTTSTQANPSKSYAATGSFTVSLTVTDNLGATGSAQTTATITQGSSTPFDWTGSFGALESGFNTYPLTFTLNLATDISQTSGPEALGSYQVESLVWDPAVLQYHSLTYLSNSGGSFNPTDATGGCKCKLIFSGGGLSPNAGLVAIAIVRFRAIGGSGSNTTARAFLGPVLSTAALGGFNYRSLIHTVNGTLSLP